MVEQVAQIWNWPVGEIQRLFQEAEGFTASHSIDHQSELSTGARLLVKAESVLSRSLVNKLADVAPQTIGRRVEQLRQEIFLAGPEYGAEAAQAATPSTSRKASGQELEVDSASVLHPGPLYRLIALWCGLFNWLSLISLKVAKPYSDAMRSLKLPLCHSSRKFLW